MLQYLTARLRGAREILFLLLCIALYAPQLNAAPEAARAFLGQSQHISLAQSADPAIANKLDHLRTLATKNGMVSVIVGVRAAFAPEGRLSAATVGTQRNEIAAAQTAALAKIPSLARKPDSINRSKYVPFMAVTVDPGELETLISTPEVNFIRENTVNRPFLDHSVPLIGGDLAWNMGYTGEGQTIAILDSGVDKNHPFLSGSVVSEACYSEGFLAGEDESLCPGFWDDTEAVDSALPYTADTNCPAQVGECDHGTHVAGIAAGKGDHSGVAPGATLIAIKVAYLDKNYTADLSDGTNECVYHYRPDPINKPAECHVALFKDNDIEKGLDRVYELRNTTILQQSI